MKKNSIKLTCRLFRFALPHWKWIVITFIALAIFTGAEARTILLIEPMMSDVLPASFSAAKKMVGEGSPEVNTTQLQELFAQGQEALLGVVVVLLLLAVVIFFSHSGSIYFQNRTVNLTIVDIRNSLCKHLLRMPLGFFESSRTGEMISQVTNDVAVTRQALMFIFGSIPLQGLRLVLGTLIAFYASWQLSLICFVAMLSIGLIVKAFGGKIRRAGRQSLERLADLTDAMQQMFSGIRVLKAFMLEKQEYSNFAGINRKYFRKVMKGVKARAFSRGTVEFASRGGGAVLLGIGGYLILYNIFGLTLVKFSIFLAACLFMYRPVKNLAKSYNNLQEALGGAERLFGLLDTEPAIIDHAEAVELPEVTQGVTFKNVTFAYDSDPVLRDVSLVAEKGEVIAVVGRTGSGKSTMLDLIPRFYDPQEGSVEIDGVDVRHIKQSSLLSHIAIVTQQTFLFNTTIAENIRYGRSDATEEEVRAAATAAYVDEFIDKLPQGFETFVGEQGARLSGGQRQRISIARAILKNAPILILDEATSELDSESERYVQDALNNLMKGRLTFIIAHRLSTVRQADKIVVLENGKIVETGTHEELLKHGGTYSRLHSMQFE